MRLPPGWARQYPVAGARLRRETLNDRPDRLVSVCARVRAVGFAPPMYSRFYRRCFLIGTVAGPRLAAAAVPRAVLGTARAGRRSSPSCCTRCTSGSRASCKGKARLFGRHPHRAHAVPDHRAARRPSASIFAQQVALLIEYLRDRQVGLVPGDPAEAREPADRRPGARLGAARMCPITAEQVEELAGQRRAVAAARRPPRWAATSRSAWSARWSASS